MSITIRETCSCGASVEVSGVSGVGYAELVIDGWRKRHADCPSPHDWRHPAAVISDEPPPKEDDKP